MFGRGWGFAYESTLVKSCSGATVKKGSGQELEYAAALCPASGTLTYPVTAAPPAGYPPGNFDKLTYNEGDYWIFEEKNSRLKYRYDLKTGGTDTYRLTRITDPNGNSQQLAYNEDGTIKTFTDAAGRVTNFSYTDGRCTAMVVPDGRTATYSYDVGGNMIQNSDLLGTVIAYAYDAGNYMTSMSYGGKTTTFTYDTSGGWKHVASVTDANGHTKTYSANSGTSTSVTDALGTVITYGNEDGRTTGKSNSATAQTASRTYANGLPVAITDARGKVTRMEYDGAGDLIKITDPLGNATNYSYDSNRNPYQRTDPLGKVWTFAHDEKGNLIEAVTPGGHKTSYTYNPQGQMTALKDANNGITTFTFDRFGNVETVTNAGGKTMTLGYDSFGFNRISETDTLSRVTAYTYDGNGRVTRITNPDGTYRTFSYDTCSLISMMDENGKTSTYERDGMNRMSRATDPLGNSTAFTYDALGNVTGIADAKMQTTAMLYDHGGRNTGMMKPSGSRVEKTYDANGNMTALKDTRSKETIFTFDDNNQPLSVQDPLGNRITWSRDVLGRVDRQINPDGVSIDYSYDDDGRLSGKTYSTGGTVAFGYNAMSNLTSMTDASGSTTYGYDVLHRLVSIAYPDGLSLAYTYDDKGNISAITYPGGLVVNYTYNNRDRIASVAWATGNTIAHTYDPAGNLTRTVHSNGTESLYSYDGNNGLIGISHKKGALVFAGMEYHRDVLGKTVEENSTLPVSPGLINQSLSATYNDANQLVTWGLDNATYDVDGNLKTVSGGRSIHALYDPEGRLTDYTVNGTSFHHTYNGLHFRTRTVTDAGTRNFHYDGAGRLMFETDGNGSITAWYTYSGRRLSAMATSAGATYFYHFDKTGHTIALTDSNGDVAAAYAYEPYGKIAGKTGTIGNPFTYVGAFGVMDEGNGLYFMKNRYYDATTGKFLQKDPIGISGGINLYGYAADNPIDYIDPDGTEWEPPYVMQDTHAGNNTLIEQVHRHNQTIGNNPTVMDTDKIWEWGVGAADKIVGAIPGWGDALAAGKISIYMGIYGYYGDWHKAIGLSSVELAKCGIGNYLTTAERFGKAASIVMNVNTDLISDYFNWGDRMTDFSKMVSYYSRTLKNSVSTSIDSLNRDAEAYQARGESVIP